MSNANMGDSFSNHVKGSDKVAVLNMAYREYKSIVKVTRVGMIVSLILALLSSIYINVGGVLVFVLGVMVVMVIRTNLEEKLNKKVGKIIQYSKFVEISQGMLRAGK